MSHQKTGGPAFPSEGGHKFMVGNDVRKTLPSRGMSLRDYFAAKAMAACISSMTATIGVGQSEENESIAMASYAIADAMLAERSK